MRTFVLWALALVLAAAAAPSAARERLALRHVALDLPGPPSKVVPADLDGDGRNDLLVVVAYSEIQEIGEDRIENMVQFSTVIPAVFDRRELRAYLAREDGTFSLAAEPLGLPPSILHLEVAPPGVIALTDDGLSRLIYRGEGDGPALSFAPLFAAKSILAGTDSFYASLQLVHDLNGDGIGDVLFPTADGHDVYLGTEGGIGPEPVDRVEVSNKTPGGGRRVHRWLPLPEIRDINGDGVNDLVFESGLTIGVPRKVEVLLGSPEGVFRPIRETAADCHDQLRDLRLAVEKPDDYPWPDNLAALRDLDGDGRAEAVFSIEQPRGDSFRKEMKDAKRPIQDFRFHRLNEDLTIDPNPYFTMKAIGHSVRTRGEEEQFLPTGIAQFQDLDNDGREDLVTITFDFSIFQALKVLTTKRIGIGVDFHVYAQRQDGTFAEVPKLDLSEKLKFDLNNLKLGRFGQFAGDFDGDGRQDFAHFGRGKLLTLHSGQPGCRYPQDPDLAIPLEEEPPSLDLIRVEDLDGDGISDILITRPLPDTDPDVTAPARLDLYLSGGAS